MATVKNGTETPATAYDRLMALALALAEGALKSVAESRALNVAEVI